MVEVQIPDSWLALRDRLSGGPRTILVVGSSDSGKSTLCRWLAAQFSAPGRPCALIDTDVGQSQIGPPACVGLGLAIEEGVQQLAAFFAGDVSPGRVLPEFLAAFAAALRTRERAGEGRTVVDTTGWTSGPEAVALKAAKATIAGEAHIVLIEREDELRAFRRAWRNLEHFPLHTLAALPEVRRRSPEERRAYREAAFRKHLQEAVECEIDLRAVAASGAVPLHLPRPSVPEGLLVGLNDEKGELLSLGILQRLDSSKGTLIVLCPLEGARAAEVRFGRLVLDRDGSHVCYGGAEETW